MNVPNIEISLSYYYQTDNNSNFFICKNVSIDSLLVIDFLMIFALSLGVSFFLYGINIFVNRRIKFFSTFQNSCNDVALSDFRSNESPRLPISVGLPLSMCVLRKYFYIFNFFFKTTMPIICMIR